MSTINTEPAPRQHDDEIDLVDLARALMRRKWWIVGTFLVFTLGALAYALQQERVYAYTTSIELGEFGPEEFVASASGTRNTIEDRILLSAKRAFLQERDELESMPFDVSVSTADESSFVNLVSEAPLDRQSLVADFHERIFERLRDEHQSRLSVLEDESDSRVETLEEALESEQRRLTILEGMGVQATQQSTEESRTRTEAQGSDGLEAQLTSTDAALTLLLSQLQLNERISEREKRINELRGELREEQTRRSWIKPTRGRGPGHRLAHARGHRPQSHRLARRTAGRNAGRVHGLLRRVRRPGTRNGVALVGAATAANRSRGELPQRDISLQ